MTYTPTADEIADHAPHLPSEVWDDCPLCWIGMTPVRFTHHFLDSVASAVVVSRDDTSYLMGITFTDGRRTLGIVYPPAGPDDLWELELGDEVVGGATAWNNRGHPDGCIDPPQEQSDTSAKPGSEAEPPSGTFVAKRDGCIEDQSPSPIDRLLGKGGSDDR